MQRQLYDFIFIASTEKDYVDHHIKYISISFANTQHLITSIIISPFFFSHISRFMPPVPSFGCAQRVTTASIYRYPSIYMDLYFIPHKNHYRKKSFIKYVRESSTHTHSHKYSRRTPETRATRCDYINMSGATETKRPTKPHCQDSTASIYEPCISHIHTYVYSTSIIECLQCQTHVDISWI